MRGPGKHRTARAVAVVAALAGAACEPRASRDTPARASLSASAPPRASSVAPAPVSAASTAPPPPRNAPLLRVVDDLADAGVALVSIGAATEIGPAGPATASPDGVVLLTKDDRLFVSRASGGKFPPVGEPASGLAALGRGPAVAGDGAYWVSRGRLVRSKLR